MVKCIRNSEVRIAGTLGTDRTYGSPGTYNFIITMTNTHCVVTFHRYTIWYVYASKNGAAASDICGVLNSIIGTGVGHLSPGSMTTAGVMRKGNFYSHATLEGTSGSRETEQQVRRAEDLESLRIGLDSAFWLFGRRSWVKRG